jgi:hypothetical protein
VNVSAALSIGSADQAWSPTWMFEMSSVSPRLASKLPVWFLAAK